MFKSLLKKLIHCVKERRAPQQRRPLAGRIETLENRLAMASMYDITWLGTASAGDNYSEARAINDHGQVVGTSGVADTSGILGPYQGFSWTASGGLVGLGTLNGQESSATAINNNGQITGIYHYYTVPYQHNGGGYYEWACFGQNGLTNTIPGHNVIGGHSVAYGNNDAGVVVGNADTSMGDSQAYVYNGTNFQLLGTLGGHWSYAMDINNNGMVVGMADTGTRPPPAGATAVSLYHPFIWTAAGGMKDIGALGTSDAYANKVNDLGQVVGYSITMDATLGYEQYHPFFYDGTTMIDIGVNLGGNGFANSINNAGQIVGGSGNPSTNKAWIYESGTMFDLNTLLSATTTDTLTEAFDINNLGQIVGVGMHNGHSESFLLSPNGLIVTPPANDPPVADAGGPYSITAGNSLTLDASLSTDPNGDPLTYSWDVNGDGVFGDAIGVNPTISWATLQSLGIAGGSTYAIAVQANDGHGGTNVASSSLTVIAATSGPTVTISDPLDGFQGVTGQTRTISLGASDTIASTGYEYTVNWGDGSYDTINGTDAAAASHVYNAVGSYAVSVTVQDSEGIISPPATTALNIQRAEQQGAVLAVGGTAADDTITLSPGATAGTIVTPFGTFATSQVMVFGGNGNDKVVVQGTAGNDSFGINPEAVAINSVAILGTAVENWTADGLAGNDIFYLNGLGLPIALKGGDGNDSFKVSAVGAVSGKVDGGAGTDLIDYSLFHSQATVNLQNSTASATGGFANMEGFVGSNSFDTLIAANTANTWAMNGYNSGKLNTVQFSSFENWTGGSGADTFKIANARYVSGVVDGGLGLNTLDYSGYTTGVAVNLAAGTATNLRSGIANITNITGGAGADTLTGNAADNIILGNAGNDLLDGGGGNDVLVGGAGNDSLTGGSGRNLLIGGLGSDTIKGSTNEDILIGGTTKFDANATALTAILSEWKRTDQTYQQRVDHLMGTVTGGKNGTNYLKSTTITDDATADLITGDAGQDWFWALATEIADKQANERLN